MVAKSKAGLGKVQCPYCKEWVAAGATRCPHCQAEYTAKDQEAMKAGQKSNLIGCGVLAVFAVLLLGFCSASGGDKDKAEIEPLASATYGPADRTPEPEVDQLAGLSPAQRNARRNAESYLAMTGFSRQGLIEQLSSEAGNGYSVADATAAVDSLVVDYNEQAARSAQSYLKMTGFSCNGLIDQLSSSAGNGYTKSEAEYGAKQAGAC